jgi:hypothetical protein
MTVPFFRTSLFFVALVVAGCGSRPDDGAAIATLIVGPEYSANKGLFIPDDTRHSLGLKVVEVGEQAVGRSLELSLRIYEVTGDGFRGSGMVTADQAQWLKPGQPVMLKSVAAQPLAGTIKSVGGGLEKVSGLTEIVAELPKAAGLRVGAFATATIPQAGNAPVATVPRSALVQTTEGNFVYTESGTHFVRTAVKIGSGNAEVVEIKDGLYSGDRIVSEPTMSLWLTELAAIKGGHACCTVPAKGK